MNFFKKMLAFSKSLQYNEGAERVGLGLAPRFIRKMIQKGDDRMPAAAVQQCFGGSQICKFDQMNRLTLPVKFRARYGNTVYLMKNIQDPDDKCILGYTEEDFVKVYDNLAKVYSGRQLTLVQRLFMDNCEMATIDSSGRVTFKPEYREFADLTEDAKVISNPDRLEFWNKDNWAKQFESEEAIPDLSQIILSPRA